MVVDTSAVIALLFCEPDALQFAERIGSERSSVMSAASYVELAILARSRGAVARALVDAALEEVGIAIVPVTVAQAHVAADAFARFGRGRHRAQLNYGDCFVYALAKERNEPLLFKGEDFVLTDLVPAL
jgi:ribonuclease VapC